MYVYIDMLPYVAASTPRFCHCLAILLPQSELQTSCDPWSDVLVFENLILSQSDWISIDLDRLEQAHCNVTGMIVEICWDWGNCNYPKAALFLVQSTLLVLKIKSSCWLNLTFPGWILVFIDEITIYLYISLFLGWPHHWIPAMQLGLLAFLRQQFVRWSFREVVGRRGKVLAFHGAPVIREKVIRGSTGPHAEQCSLNPVDNHMMLIFKLNNTTTQTQLFNDTFVQFSSYVFELWWNWVFY